MKGAPSNWEEFEEVAGGIFKVWGGVHELAWAQGAWRRLADAGLTDYSTELERTQVCIRLMALGAIYMDFCYHAWEEECFPDFSDWSHRLEIQPFQLGRLVQAGDTSKFIELEPFADECEFLAQAYLALTDSERPKIHAALCGTEAPIFKQAYLDLHQSRAIADDTEDDAWDDVWPAAGSGLAKSVARARRGRAKKRAFI